MNRVIVQYISVLFLSFSYLFTTFMQQSSLNNKFHTQSIVSAFFSGIKFRIFSTELNCPRAIKSLTILIRIFSDYFISNSRLLGEKKF